MHHKDTQRFGTPWGYNGNLYASLVSDPDLISEAFGESILEKVEEEIRENTGERVSPRFWF